MIYSSESLYSSYENFPSYPENHLSFSESYYRLPERHYSIDSNNSITESNLPLPESLYYALEDLFYPRIIPTITPQLFDVVCLLGNGGFSNVFEAEFKYNKQKYAVKSINKTQILKSKNGFEMIHSEFKAMKLINHESIPKLFSSFIDKENLYLVFNVYTGGDLRYYLKNKFHFWEEEVAFIIMSLASALDYIHSKGIIHRDVKPENIIFDSRGYPHLTDFGVAFVNENFISDGLGNSNAELVCNSISGTRQYLAPETFTKSHIHGPEVDFWSLGIILYEIVFHKRPFENHAPIEYINYLNRAYENMCAQKMGYHVQKNIILFDGAFTPKGFKENYIHENNQSKYRIWGSHWSSAIFLPENKHPANFLILPRTTYLLDYQAVFRIVSNKPSKIPSRFQNFPYLYDEIKPTINFLNCYPQPKNWDTLSIDLEEVIRGLLAMKPHERWGGRNLFLLTESKWLKNINEKYNNRIKTWINNNDEIYSTIYHKFIPVNFCYEVLEENLNRSIIKNHLTTYYNNEKHIGIFNKSDVLKLIGNNQSSSSNNNNNLKNNDGNLNDIDYKVFEKLIYTSDDFKKIIRRAN